MKNTPSIVKYIYFLLIPVLLAYPNKLFEGKYINYIYIFSCFGLMLITQINVPIRTNRIISFFKLLFIVILLANIVSFVLAHNIGGFDYLSSTLRYLSYVAISLLLFNTTKDQHDLLFWIKSFLFGFILSLIIILLDSYRVGFVEHIFKIETFESKETLDVFFRAYGAYLSPISAGVFLLNAFVFLNTMLLYIKMQKLTKVLLYLVLGVTIVCLFMTASRTALVGLFVYVFLLILGSKQRFNILLLTLILGIFIHYSGVIDVYIENILLRNQAESQVSDNILKGSGRVDTLLNSIRLYADWRTLLFGVGPSEYSKGDGTFSLAHNGFISLVLCYGLAGVILFYRLLYFLYKKICDKNVFLTKVFFYYTIVNCVTFISSDGPVTHFWMINFIFFLYFVFNIKILGIERDKIQNN